MRISLVGLRLRNNVASRQKTKSDCKCYFLTAPKRELLPASPDGLKTAILVKNMLRRYALVYPLAFVPPKCLTLNK
jgi:hypothetical protein